MKNTTEILSKNTTGYNVGDTVAISGKDYTVCKSSNLDGTFSVLGHGVCRPLKDLVAFIEGHKKVRYNNDIRR